MILKQKDSLDKDIQELEYLLTLPLNAQQRFFIERELKYVRSGERGEQNSAYYIDYWHKNSRNTVVIHDVRIQHLGAVAQIDHLLINRFLDIYVLESKNYYYGIKITENGEFMISTGKGFQGVQSPIEQNKRHIELLQKSIEDRSLAPKRLGISIKPSFKSYVLVSPSAQIDRPSSKRFNTDAVIKADALMAALDKEVDEAKYLDMVNIVKIVSRETIEELGQKIVRLHRPCKIDYAAKFGIGKDVLLPKSRTSQIPPPIPAKDKVTSPIKTCEECGKAVDNKVVYYCGINKQRFGCKILCRDCQKGYKQ